MLSSGFDLVKLGIDFPKNQYYVSTMWQIHHLAAAPGASPWVGLGMNAEGEIAQKFQDQHLQAKELFIFYAMGAITAAFPKQIWCAFPIDFSVFLSRFNHQQEISLIRMLDFHRCE